MWGLWVEDRRSQWLLEGIDVLQGTLLCSPWWLGPFQGHYNLISASNQGSLVPLFWWRGEAAWSFLGRVEGCRIWGWLSFNFRRGVFKNHSVGVADELLIMSIICMLLCVVGTWSPLLLLMPERLRERCPEQQRLTGGIRRSRGSWVNYCSSSRQDLLVSCKPSCVVISGWLSLVLLSWSKATAFWGGLRETMQAPVWEGWRAWCRLDGR